MKFLTKNQLFMVQQAFSSKLFDSIRAPGSEAHVRSQFLQVLDNMLWDDVNFRSLTTEMEKMVESFEFQRALLQQFLGERKFRIAGTIAKDLQSR